MTATPPPLSEPNSGPFGPPIPGRGFDISAIVTVAHRAWRRGHADGGTRCRLKRGSDCAKAMFDVKAMTGGQLLGGIELRSRVQKGMRKTCCGK